MSADVELLRSLWLAPGPTGFEAPAREVPRRRLAPLLVPGRHFVIHGAGGPVQAVGGKKPTHLRRPAAMSREAP